LVASNTLRSVARAVAPDGTIYSVGSQINNLYKLDPSGRVLATVGGASGLLAISPQGKVFVIGNTSGGNGVYVYEVTPGFSLQQVATVGSPQDRSVSDLSGLAADSAGNFFLSFSGTQLYELPLGQGVGTIAGGKDWGFADGPGASARFSILTSIGMDAAGNIYAADTDVSGASGSRIRKITLGN
jgi:hypothetical protein